MHISRPFAPSRVALLANARYIDTPSLGSIYFDVPGTESESPQARVPCYSQKEAPIIQKYART